MHDPSDYQGREGFEALRKVKDEMAKIDHPAILKPQANKLPDSVERNLREAERGRPQQQEEAKKLLYRQYTCDPQGLAALCCELDGKGYEPVQIVPGFFGSGVQGPFHSAMGWTVLARLKVVHFTEVDWSTERSQTVYGPGPRQQGKTMTQEEIKAKLEAAGIATVVAKPGQHLGFSSSVPVVTDVKLDESGKLQATREQLPIREVPATKTEGRKRK